MAQPTPQSKFRLTAADKAKIRAVREHYGLSSDAEAVRVALHEAAKKIRPGPKKPS